MSATIEDLTSFIIRRGIEEGYEVIPEFTFPGENNNKKIDIVWAKRRKGGPSRSGSLTNWDIVRCFEIEGIDVVADRIRSHADDFERIQNICRGCECYIVFYDEAFHRKSKWAKPLTQKRKDRVIGSIPNSSAVKVRFSDDYKSL